MSFHDQTATFLRRTGRSVFAGVQEAAEFQRRALTDPSELFTLAPGGVQTLRQVAPVIAGALTPKEGDMGFFSSILKIGGKILGSVLGIAKPAVRAAAPIARRVAVPAAIGAVGVGAGALAFGGGDPAAAGGAFVNPATGEIVGGAGGNGLMVTTTLVTTVNRATGQIVKQRSFLGSPFLMNKEVAHLKSTIKKIGRADRKVPRRTVQPSLNSLINSAIKDRMLHSAQASVQAATC